MGVFSRQNQPTEGRKRNAFDGSFQNNLTFKFGELIPCMCREVIPGDSFRINTAFGLRFMPLAFPIQTKVKAKIDFFYVRYRNLWDGWKNWYFKTGAPGSFPVLSESEATEQSKTGSLGDYLGLPSTIVGRDDVLFKAAPFFPGSDFSVSPVPARNFKLAVFKETSSTSPDNTNPAIYYLNTSSLTQFAVSANLKATDNNSVFYFSTDQSDISSPYYLDVDSADSIVIDGEPYVAVPSDASVLLGSRGWLPLVVSVTDYYGYGTSLPINYAYSTAYYYTDGLTPRCLQYDGKLYVLQDLLTENDGGRFFIAFVPPFNPGIFDNMEQGQWSHGSGFVPSDLLPLPSWTILSSDQTYGVVEATSVLENVPYTVSAMPFRAYEQIYNAFYRDDRNNPYVVNGVADPNVFIPTLDGGTDNNQYRVRYRNWEQDFLTTALPSPQYGNAPLVGITNSGVAQFENSDGSIVTSKLETSSDGDTIVGFSTTNVPSVNRSLVELASSGISINDLRGVNSLQRFLEAKYRACLRYRDQMRIHFNSDIKYDEVDMPEFLGSVTSMCNIDQINQNSASVEDNPLGSYAGQMSCMGGSNGSIHHYFDEPGLIMAIVSVVPVPCYSQLLPKHFTKVNDSLEYYFSEFAHLGYQAIPYREVCPLQATLNGVSLDSTFGYQRPWYDYISSQDEVHGQFRTTLNNFVLARVFNQVPSLNEDFLTVRPESLNDVFTINSVEDPSDSTKMVPVDTILGQIHFDITMQRPIPRFGVPRLE